MTPTVRPTLKVRPVGNAADIRSFVRLPRTLYRSDPLWPAPVEIERRAFLNPRKHPFYRHGSAQAFLAYEGKTCVGRILAAEDPRYNEVHNARAGTFGLFESVDDPAVARALVDAGSEWLRARGAKTLLGPIDLSINYPCGLLVEGFETTPAVLLNYNPPYYQGLLEGCGLRKAKDLYTYWFHDGQPVPERWERIAERARVRNRIRVRPVDVRDFERELGRIETIYNAAWENNWGAVPMTPAEYAHMGSEVKPLLLDGLVLLAEIDGEAVGFSLSLPDLNPILQQSGGRLFPTGALRLLWALRRPVGRIRGIRMLALGVLEAYRRRGVAEQLILATIRNAKALGIRSCEMGWTLEDNHSVNRTIEAVGGTRIRRYRIYEREIG